MIPTTLAFGWRQSLVNRKAREWFDSTPSFPFDIVRVLSDSTAAAFLWEYEVPGVEEYPACVTMHTKG